ncbi:hypothetical protein GN156_14665 [bacterium LRH843]|nr:hypothetical protein [bacterium LRH843]
MGGQLKKREVQDENLVYSRVNHEKINEKYFRPSCYPALNVRIDQFSFFDPYFDKDVSEFILPSRLMKTPEDTILNYFSILREAANLSGKAAGGCGTVGMANIPYPVAYHFLTYEYQKRVNYKKFTLSFQNIGHINLIKLSKVTHDSYEENVFRYFIELETIQGSEKEDVTFFAYYYGFVTIKKEHDRFKIEDVILHGEDFLCAAYHGWDHEAEGVVDVKYGSWCHLVKKRYPTYKHAYVKNISVSGTDGHDYLFVFAELTNGTDVEIAQFIKGRHGEWIPIHLNPNKCVENKQ